MTGIQTDLFDGVPTPMELRDYQRDCLNALAQYRRDGGARALVVLPTGLGKTVIFSQVPKYAKGKVLVVAHREELIQQAADKIHQANPFLDIQVEQAASRAGKAAQVIVASIQTLISGERLRR
ncbi:MAG: DEAD/DEAH box helicase family protein, partial [Dehalococcoidia bacterium]|nr:DEAD/DEAH box helicase family protein [Dehalococcoidia bacterium]